MEPQPSTSHEKVTDLSSPRTKRPKVTSFTVNEKNMVINTYKYVKESWPTDKYPYRKEMALKTASILGIGVASVYRILKDLKEHGQISAPITTKTRPMCTEKIDDFTKSVIRKKVYAFFLNGELPTMKKVLNDINEDDTLPDFKRTTFQKILKHLNFKYIKKHRNRALFDRDDIVLWRRKYLHKIKEYREKHRRIFYMDYHYIPLPPGLILGNPVNKTWVDTEIKAKRRAFLEGLNTCSKSPASKSRRLIVVHIGNEEGFVEDGSWVFEPKVSGDNHESMDAAHFENWFASVLPKLGEYAVVVMDNAPYHSRRQENTPSSNWSKAKIQQWLRDKNIDFDESEIKLQLFKKVRELKDRYHIYAVDELAKNYGVEILRLPPYHCELNPIELIWADIKGYVARNIISVKFEKVKELLSEGMAKVTLDRWRKCVELVQKEEEKFYKLDFIVDNVTDKFITHVADSDSESTNSEESASD